MGVQTGSSDDEGLGWKAARVTTVVLAITLSVAILIYTANGFLILFGGVLFAVVLCAATDLLGRALPIRRAFRLAIVCVVLTAGLVGLIGGAGYIAVTEGPTVINTLDDETRNLRNLMSRYGVDDLAEDEDADADSEEGSAVDGLASYLPDPSNLLGHVGAAFATTFGVAGNAILILALGVYLAAQPDVYVSGAVKLVAPSRRARARSVILEIGEILRFWLVGQLVIMVIVGVVVWAALAVVGMPGALTLGLVSGLLNFIPIIGPILAGVAIVLVAMSQELWIVFYALGVYLFIQTLESEVLTPLVQRRAVNLPPGMIIAALLIMGLLFGFPGIVVATPVAAALKIALERFYVEDTLGDRSAASSGAPAAPDAASASATSANSGR